MKYIKNFHRDLLTLNSHHWKYYLDYYKGCNFGCVYCLNAFSYDFFGLIKEEENYISKIENELKTLDKRIVFLGSNSDPYNIREEKFALTRQILELLLKYEIPLTLLTKSDLVLRDLDIIEKLNAKNLVLIQFTVIADNFKSSLLEPNAVSVDKRIDAIKKISTRGIPVHVHVSPIIPQLNNESEMESLLKTLKNAGVTCVYSNILGIHFHSNSRLINALEQIKPSLSQEVFKLYSVNSNKQGKYIYSPSSKVIESEMKPYSDIAKKVGIDFVNEAMPAYSTFTRYTKEKIFDFALPTTVDFIAFIRAYKKPLSFSIFFDEFLKKRIDYSKEKQYVTLVKKLWDTRELFKNSDIKFIEKDKEVFYVATKKINIGNDVYCWDT